MKIGGRYNWKGQPERLVYIGRKGAWHQFALTTESLVPWCEVLEEHLHMLEETSAGADRASDHAPEVVTMPANVRDCFRVLLAADREFDAAKDALCDAKRERGNWLVNPLPHTHPAVVRMRAATRQRAIALAQLEAKLP